ncbi:MAG: hypothetical protein EBZ95_04875 [Chitinophagia bacterium]|nr:hypothetical protein [Chitinophagia bacterium]
MFNPLSGEFDLVGNGGSSSNPILEFTNLAAFPATGILNTIYIALDTKKMYIWSGSTYVESSPSEVNSVNGATGVVVLNSDNISEGTTNKYYTDSRAQTAAVVNSTSGSQTNQAPSVSSIKSYIGTQISGITYPVTSVNTQTGAVSLSTDNVAEGSTNKYYTDGRAQTASVVNSLSGSQTTQAPAVAAVNSALSGKFNTPAGTTSQYVRGDGSLNTFPTIPTNLDSLSDVTISGPSNGQILTYDNATSQWKNLAPASAGSSAGDIVETSFSFSNNQSLAANITGLSFAIATVRSFEILISIEVNATANLYQVVKLLGIQKNSSWDMMQTSTGDNCQVIFSITSAGQIQYISGNTSGFTSGKIKFRAITTTIG